LLLTSQAVLLGKVGKATVFWNSGGIGIVPIDYLEHGSTITGTYYAELVGKCRAAVKEKRRRQ